MRSITYRLLACLLCAILLLGAVACNDSDISPVETDTAAPDTSTAPTPGTDKIASETDPVTDPDAETVPLPADLEVTVQDGTAHVLTPTGLAYTVTGYDSIEKAEAAVTFTEGLTVTFPEDTFAEDFNRFSVAYESTAPLRVYVTYSERGKQKEDDYFLEAGEGTFSGLTSGFMKGLHGKKLSALRIDTCEGSSASFTLAGMTTELMQVPGSSLYIENDAFKLGIDLGWGGTINYLEDKTCPVSGLSNLVNKHDTGRLIQQSFYGTPGVAGEYEPGISFDSKWVYNPVQGGDQYNNPSRLIDLVITESSVYIKSQPQDWSLDGALTPSYMENTYTLEADYVRVDNRFTDFSGWEHPFSAQELPALYTVSYLDKFVWYNGEGSWQGDELSFRDDLNFWGDAAYAADCMFPYREKNTETWCAWVSSADDYGIGLYVPNVDQLKAGRYGYDGSKSDMADPTNYVAPINILKMVSFQPITYSYMLTTGSTAAIRETFTRYKDFTSNATLHESYQSSRLPSVEGDITKLDLTTAADLDLLMNPVSTTVTFDEAEGAAKLTAGAAGDASVTLPYNTAYEPLSAADYTTLRIEYRIPEGNSATRYQSDLFLCAGDIKEADGNARLRVDLIADGAYHVLEVDLSTCTYWSGDIHKIRFDYFDSSSDGDVMYIKSITLE